MLLPLTYRQEVSKSCRLSQYLRHSRHFIPSHSHLTSWRHPKKGEYGIRYFEKERPHPHHFYYRILLQLFYFIIVVVNLLQCLIYKLKYITSTYGEKNQYISSLVLFAISDIHWGSWNVSCVEGLHDISQNNWIRKYFLPRSEKTRNALESQKIFLAKSRPQGQPSPTQHWAGGWLQDNWFTWAMGLNLQIWLHFSLVS